MLWHICRVKYGHRTKDYSKLHIVSTVFCKMYISLSFAKIAWIICLALKLDDCLLFLLFRRRSKSNRKLIFSLACSYLLNYVNTDSWKGAAVPQWSLWFNAASTYLDPWWLSPEEGENYKLCCFAEFERERHSGNVFCSISLPYMCCHLQCIRVPLHFKFTFSSAHFECFAGGRPGSFASSIL